PKNSSFRAHASNHREEFLRLAETMILPEGAVFPEALWKTLGETWIMDVPFGVNSSQYKP
ncbi:MAG TPA: hypothetical protein VMZ26_15300, partial [Pyrinomonadaceae bacterium]|nr:hypothetical protein [Pyrinomonadaceae bacterium]